MILLNLFIKLICLYGPLVYLFYRIDDFANFWDKPIEIATIGDIYTPIIVIIGYIFFNSETFIIDKIEEAIKNTAEYVEFKLKK